MEKIKLAKVGHVLLADKKWNIGERDSRGRISVGLPKNYRKKGDDDLVIRRRSGRHYVVIHTAMTGGGTGHGPLDVYPDGHCVVAKELTADMKLKYNGEVVKFYQTGAFNCMIPNPIIDGTMPEVAAAHSFADAVLAEINGKKTVDAPTAKTIYRAITKQYTLNQLAEHWQAIIRNAKGK